MPRGGANRGQGRKKGSTKLNSRDIKKHYRVNRTELDLMEKAAKVEGKALSKFVADSALRAAAGTLPTTARELT